MGFGNSFCGACLFLLIGLIAQNAIDGEFECFKLWGDKVNDLLDLRWFDLSDCDDDFICLPGGFGEG